MWSAGGGVLSPAQLSFVRLIPLRVNDWGYCKGPQRRSKRSNDAKDGSIKSWRPSNNYKSASTPVQPHTTLDVHTSTHMWGERRSAGPLAAALRSRMCALRFGPSYFLPCSYGGDNLSLRKSQAFLEEMQPLRVYEEVSLCLPRYKEGGYIAERN